MAKWLQQSLLFLIASLAAPERERLSDCRLPEITRYATDVWERIIEKTTGVMTSLVGRLELFDETAIAGGRTKAEKFRILDSPPLLKQDLSATDPGLFGATCWYLASSLPATELVHQLRQWPYLPDKSRPMFPRVFDMDVVGCNEARKIRHHQL